MSPEYRAVFESGWPIRLLERPTSELEAFVESLGLAPIRCVACAPREWCEPKRCFVNVEAQVAKEGGRMLAGWIWQEWMGCSLTGEAHAIWISKEGKMRDITPHDGSPPRVAFCEDSRVLAKRAYTAPPKKIISMDERVIKLESYAGALDRLFDRAFKRMGDELLIYPTEVRQAARDIGLPDDVADLVFNVKISRHPRVS